MSNIMHKEKFDWHTEHVIERLAHQNKRWQNSDGGKPLFQQWLGWESRQTFLGTVGYKNRGMTKHFLMTARKFEVSTIGGSFLI